MFVKVIGHNMRVCFLGHSVHKQKRTLITTAPTVHFCYLKQLQICLPIPIPKPIPFADSLFCFRWRKSTN